MPPPPSLCSAAAAALLPIMCIYLIPDTECARLPPYNGIPSSALISIAICSLRALLTHIFRQAGMTSWGPECSRIAFIPRRFTGAHRFIFGNHSRPCGPKFVLRRYLCASLSCFSFYLSIFSFFLLFSFYSDLYIALLSCSDSLIGFWHINMLPRSMERQKCDRGDEQPR